MRERCKRWFLKLSEEDIVWLGIAVFVGIMLIGAVSSWYGASVQAAVYRRQGVEMSTWEVMCGAKPVERSFRVAPEKN